MVTANQALHRFAAVFVLYCGLVVSASANKIVVEHAQGTTTLAGTPKTVLTFDLATLDTLHALGVKVTGVPDSNIPDYLAQYRGGDYLKVGSLFEPDYEAVHAAQADLIVVAMRSSPSYEQLSQIAPTVDLSIKPDNFLEGTRANARLLGRIFGKEAEAEALVERLDASVSALRDAATDAGDALVVMTSGGKVTAYGPGSRFGWVHDDLGIQPAVGDVEAATHGEAVSFEFVMQTNPDWLLVVDRDSAIGSAGAAAAQTLDNELVGATSAARNGRIVYVDTVRWYLVAGGVDALRVSVDQLLEAYAD
jgi:iron complex transport system substrate-binding protein